MRALSAALAAVLLLQACAGPRATGLSMADNSSNSGNSSANSSNDSSKPRFCALLAAHRGEILEPLRGLDDVSLDTAVRVMARVGELAVSDPVLERDAEAFMARHPEG